MAGFNLIELMFVVLIIAVLGGLGFPALSQAMKQAEWSKTRGQMKSVVSAFHTYAAENNNFMPPAYFPDGTKDGRWLDTTIFPYVYPESAFNGTDAGGGEVGYDSRNGTHLLETVFVVSASMKAAPDDENYYNHTFLLNRSLISDPAAPNPEFMPRQLSRYTDWTAVMLLAEGPEGNNNSVSFSDLTQIEQGMNRYDGRFSHFAFLDGHVEQVRKKDLEAMQQVQPGSSGDQFAAAWHTAWFGVSPEAYPKVGGGRLPVNY